MRIVKTIIEILEEMVNDTNCALKSYQYNDRPTANVTLDRGKESPTALLYQITDWKMGLNQITEKERATIMISFLTKEAALDALGLPQDDVIDEMKDIAIDFVQRLKMANFKIYGDDIVAKSVYLRSDSNRTGVMLMIDVEEKQGQCIGVTPTPITLEIDANGEYNVFGYSKAVVNVPEATQPLNMRLFSYGFAPYDSSIQLTGMIVNLTDDCTTFGIRYEENRYGQRVVKLDSSLIPLNPMHIVENSYPIAVYINVSDTDEDYKLTYGKYYYAIPYMNMADGTVVEFNEYLFGVPNNRLDITENGTYNTAAYAKVNVNVQ